jgi:hypothetical protein
VNSYILKIKHENKGLAETYDNVKKSAYASQMQTFQELSSINLLKLTSAQAYSVAKIKLQSYLDMLTYSSRRKICNILFKEF